MYPISPGLRPDRILPSITKSAAVTTSSEAGELGVDMITCESAQNPGVRPSDQLGAAPFQTHTRGGPWPIAKAPRGQGGWKKILKPPDPDRGGASVPPQPIWD